MAFLVTDLMRIYQLDRSSLNHLVCSSLMLRDPLTGLKVTAEN
jgi:hypothetical protein